MPEERKGKKKKTVKSRYECDKLINCRQSVWQQPRDKQDLKHQLDLQSQAPSHYSLSKKPFGTRRGGGGLAASPGPPMAHPSQLNPTLERSKTMPEFPSPSLVTASFLKRGESRLTCFPQRPSPETRKQGRKARAKPTSGLGVTTHRSRVEFSCSLSLSMTGWIPSMRNSYLRCSLKSKLSCKGTVVGSMEQGACLQK